MSATFTQMMGDYGKEAGSQFGKGVRQAAGWQSKDEILQGIHEQADYTTPQGVKAVLDKLKAVDYQEYQKAKTAIEDSGVNLAQIENYKASTAASIASQDRAATTFSQEQAQYELDRDAAALVKSNKDKIQEALRTLDLNTPEGKQEYLALLNTIDPELANKFILDGLTLKSANQTLSNLKLDERLKSKKLDEVDKSIIERDNAPFIAALNKQQAPGIIKDWLSKTLPGNPDNATAHSLEEAMVVIRNAPIEEGRKGTLYDDLEKYMLSVEQAFYDTWKHDTNLNSKFTTVPSEELFPKKLDPLNITSTAPSAAGTLGVTANQVNPKDSQFTQSFSKEKAQSEIQVRVAALAQKRSSSKFEWFMNDEEKAREDAEDKATRWIYTHQDYFLANPNKLAEAERDVVAFYNSLPAKDK